ncbi:MAG: DUF1761 domain-containing protein [Gemmatimonadetes bacterium]|nr:DUF1761 domain-containing protein [Gemmatimonadota bacterium]
MEPTIPLNYLAIIIAAIVMMPIGYLWFGPVFGEAWAKEMGMEDEQPDGMAKSLILIALGNLIMVFVLAHSQGVWRAGVSTASS